MTANSIILQSGGSTFEIPTPFNKPVVFVTPKAYKEVFAGWDKNVKMYVVVTMNGEVLHIPDNAIPSQLPLSIKYCGKSVKKFYDLLAYVLKRYYRGGPILKIPVTDKYAYKFAIYLTRMSELQPIDDL
jgi:hypothetical protein